MIRGNGVRFTDLATERNLHSKAELEPLKFPRYEPDFPKGMGQRLVGLSPTHGTEAASARFFNAW